MATLGPASALHVTGACVAVREGQREGEAVLTLSRAVEVHNVSPLHAVALCSGFRLNVFFQLFDHRCVHSWPVGSTDHVTCPAHFHKAMGRYCAVRNGNVSGALVWNGAHSGMEWGSHGSEVLSLLTGTVAVELDRQESALQLLQPPLLPTVPPPHLTHTPHCHRGHCWHGCHGSSGEWRGEGEE